MSPLNVFAEAPTHNGATACHTVVAEVIIPPGDYSSYILRHRSRFLLNAHIRSYHIKYRRFSVYTCVLILIDNSSNV